MAAFLDGTSDEGFERRLQLRSQIDALIYRAEMLMDRDRLLIEQVYRHGVSVADIARLYGWTPSRLRRHIAKLRRNMTSPLFTYVLSHEASLPESVRRTARLVVLQGHSLRRAASLSQQTLHQVRVHIGALRVLAAG